LLVEKGLVSNRNRARSLLMSGVVYVDGLLIDKAGAFVKEDSIIDVKDDHQEYVSRGGIKLEAAINQFNIDVGGKIALDIGASTGGFTDCLLQFGARKVYAVDVGYGQLDWSLRQDSRVVLLERVNARYLRPEEIGELVDISTFDVSFISLTLIVPAIHQMLKNSGVIIALIKPQFEVGKGEVGKGGIVRDGLKHTAVVEKISSFLDEFGYKVMGVISSPILGADGNKEFLVAAIKHK